VWAHQVQFSDFTVQYLDYFLTNAFLKQIKKNTNDDNLCWYKFNLGLTGGIDNAAHIGGLLSGASE
jgi:membrane associated rhomboid family serine protease